MYEPQKTEREILKFWKQRKIFDKLRKKNKGKKTWSFLDGPITANNPMGVHHAWGRTYKDLFQRYKAMQGFQQRFQNGFDCQGLWLEVETEKELGFNSKKDIEKYGLAKFSRACRKRVEKYSKIQTEQSIKLGQWMDWPNSYYTMSDENIEAIWYFLKKCYENGWLYKGKKILPWCIRCGTSSSQHEMSEEGYQEVTHLGVYVKFKIKNKKEYLLAWTTTEWTLSSNVALAVNPEMTYVKVQENDDILYLSENNLNKLKTEGIVLEHLKGKDLVGLEYEPLYDFEVQKFKHKVVPWTEVGEEGTGIVHIAPTCGAEDYELALKEKLPIINPALDENGNYLEGFGWLTGKNVRDVKEKIIQDLKDRGFIYKTEPFKHRYPLCWRCRSELVFRMASEWFISCDKIRPLMKKAARTVKWVPKHLGKLMQDWLNNMQDWNISRKRYWGLPLMFYECKCGHLEVIGSRKELREKAINKKLVDKIPELHRPWIDRIKIKCPECCSSVERIKDVGDCWLDAGIVPFSTLKYFSDKNYWKKWFPADLVVEMRAQIRLWFYSLLFMSVTLEKKAPYKQVFAYEVVKDEKGEDMHKSKGNAIWFDDAVEKMGADVMRWIYLIQNPIYPLRFGYSVGREVKKNLDVIWNLGNYIKLYCKVNNVKILGKDYLSRWLISRTESLKKKVVDYLENLQPNLAMSEITNFFIKDLSRTYVHYIRDKIDEKNVQNLLYWSFLEALKLFAPFLPFISEKIYQELKTKEMKESIFLEDYPKADTKKINPKIEREFEILKLIIESGLALRSKEKISVRWPLNKIIVYSERDEILKTIQKFQDIIKNQLNVGEVEIKKAHNTKGFQFKYGEIVLDTKLTPELEAKGFSREIIRRIQVLRKKAGLVKEDLIETFISCDSDLEKKLINDFKTIAIKTNSKIIDFSEKQKIEKLKYNLKFNLRQKKIFVGFKVLKNR